MSLVSVCCAVIAGLALAHAIDQWRRLRHERLLRYVSPGQARRRIGGSLAALVLAVLVDVGLEVIDPHARPGLFLVLWSMVVLLVVGLLFLALLDLREVRANQELEQAVKMLQTHGRSAGAEAPSPPEEKLEDSGGESP